MKSALLECLVKLQESAFYPRIINDKAMKRLEVDGEDGFYMVEKQTLRR